MPYINRAAPKRRRLERERGKKPETRQTQINPRPEVSLSLTNIGLRQQKTKLTEREHKFVLKTEQKKRRKINRNRDAGKEYNVKSRRSKKKVEGRSVVLSNHA